MKRQRRTFNKVQINTYLNKYQEFTGTKKAFCDEHNLSVHTFTNWHRSQSQSFDSSFIEIEVPTAEHLAPLITCGGFSLSNFDTIPQSKLCQILHSMKVANDVSTSAN